MPDSKLVTASHSNQGQLAKLSQGPRISGDVKVSAGLSRGPGTQRKLNAAAWTNAWPTPGATLDLDFANNRGFVRGVGQGGVMDAITFTRASNGTFVGSNGQLAGSGGNQGALGLNLLTFPQDFDNAAWVKTGGSITANNAIAPDGTQTADIFTASASLFRVQQQLTVASGTYTFTIYLQRISGLAQYEISINGVNFTNITVTNIATRFNVTTTTVGTIFVQVKAQDATIFDNLLLWGAQLEVGFTATTYYPTNINAPRFDWASTAQLANKNLLNYTEQFENAAWTKGSASIIADSTVAPDGSTSADTITITAGGNLVFRANGIATIAQQYTASIYFKAGTITSATLNFATGGISVGASCTFDLSAGTAGSVTNRGSITGATAAISDAGNGWWRCSVSFVSTAASYFHSFSTTSTIGTFFAWGAQVEAGPLSQYQAVGAYFATNTPLAANPTSNGLLIEESRTNRLLWCRDATQTNWTKTSVTAAKDQTGVDGVANAASSLTATADNGTCIQTITLASGSRTGSVYLKRITGTGNVQVSLDGSTWSTVDLSNGLYNRIVLSGTVTNPVVGIRLATNGDAVAMDYGQVEDGAFATTPVLTTTATATRSLDSATLVNAALFSQARGEGTFYCKVSYESGTNGSQNGGGFVVMSDGGNANRIWIAKGNFAGPNSFDSALVTNNLINYASVGVPIQINSGQLITAGTVWNLAVSYTKNRFSFSINGYTNGNMVGTNTAIGYSLLPSGYNVPNTLDRIVFGTGRGNADSAFMSGWISRVTFIPEAVSDAGLINITGQTT